MSEWCGRRYHRPSCLDFDRPVLDLGGDGTRAARARSAIERLPDFVRVGRSKVAEDKGPSRPFTSHFIFCLNLSVKCQVSQSTQTRNENTLVYYSDTSCLKLTSRLGY